MNIRACFKLKTTKKTSSEEQQEEVVVRSTRPTGAALAIFKWRLPPPLEVKFSSVTFGRAGWGDIIIRGGSTRILHGGSAECETSQPSWLRKVSQWTGSFLYAVLTVGQSCSKRYFTSGRRFVPFLKSHSNPPHQENFSKLTFSPLKQPPLCLSLVMFPNPYLAWALVSSLACTPSSRHVGTGIDSRSCAELGDGNFTTASKQSRNFSFAVRTFRYCTDGTI